MEPIVFDIYYIFKMANHAAYLFFKLRNFL